MKNSRVYWRFFRKKHVSPTWRRALHFAENATEMGERDWKKITLFMIVVAFVGYLIAFLYVFPFGGADFDKRARAITPFLVFLAAAATFFSILWRGVITAKQAEEAKRANDSKDEIELALLLEKANELLQKTEGRDKFMALAMLETVASAENPKYSAYALDLVADEVVDAYSDVSGGDGGRRDECVRRQSQIRRIFRKCAEFDPPRLLARRARFTFPNPIFEANPIEVRVKFRPIVEIPYQQIESANIDLDHECFDRLNQVDNSWYFWNCELKNFGYDLVGRRFYQPLTSIDGRFHKCEFSGFVIGNVEELAGLFSSSARGIATDCVFRNCDLTSAKLTRAFFQNNSFINCSYQSDLPPVLMEADDKSFEEFARENDIDIKPAPPLLFGSLYGIGPNGAANDFETE